MEQSQFSIVLPSNSSMEMFPDNKTSSYKVVLPHTLKVDRERYEVALSEIQFPVTWYNMREGKNFFVKTVHNVTDKEFYSYYERNDMIPLAKEHKFKPTPGTVKVTIPPGHYSKPEEIVTLLNEKESKRLRPIKFHYDSIGRRIKMTLEKHCTLKMSSSDIALCLGFHGQEYKTEKESKSFISESIASVTSMYHSIYVYTNIIENQHTGNFKVPLLRVVPVQANYGQLSCVNYDRPHYMPLSQSEIQTIEVDLRDDTGDLVSFESGKVVTTLLFRRKQAKFYY